MTMQISLLRKTNGRLVHVYTTSWLRPALLRGAASSLFPAATGHMGMDYGPSLEVGTSQAPCM
jgi:hypothetical protein